MKHYLLSLLLLSSLHSMAQPAAEEYFDKNGRVGIKLENGTVVVPGKYEWLSPRFKKALLSEGLSYFRLNKKFGFIDAKGNERIPARYHKTWDFSDGWAKVEQAPGLDVFIDKQGNEYILNTDYDTCADYFSNGLLAVKKNGKWGFMNKKSKLIVPYQYDAVSDFKDSMAPVSNGGTGKHNPSFNINSYRGKWGFINTAGKLAIPMQYEATKFFSEGLCAVEPINNNSRPKWGFINKQGEMVIPAQYDIVGEGFSDGMAAVGKDLMHAVIRYRWTFINKKGEAINNFSYDYVEPFSNGIALVNIGGKGSVTFTGGQWGFIDRSGKPLFPFISCARIFGDGAMLARSGSVEVWLKETPSAPGDIYRINIKGERIKTP